MVKATLISICVQEAITMIGRKEGKKTHGEGNSNINLCSGSNNYDWEEGTAGYTP